MLDNLKCLEGVDILVFYRNLPLRGTTTLVFQNIFGVNFIYILVF
ncbi:MULTISPECIES: hypothetical protein [unclassified Campylobacter]|nr:MULTISPECIES: hypothetical protein [unclassified Campylobacter]MDA3062483.1 hypothetical protein [Campylobacter sp. JMF_14 EL1]MDA3073398.1 hypothetical protein [Campylobacter sp. JMF_10 EL2]